MLILMYCIVAVLLFVIIVSVELFGINAMIRDGKHVSAYDRKDEITIVFFACMFWPATLVVILIFGFFSMITKAFDWVSFKFLDIMIETIKFYQEKKRLQEVLIKCNNKDKEE